MKINQKLKIALRNLLMTCGEMATDKAVLLYDGEMAEGIEVFVEVEGEVVPAEDGEYAAEDGRVIVVAEGKVAEIREAEKPAEEPAEEPAPEAELAEIAPEADPIDSNEPENNDEPEVNADDKIAALEAKMADFTSALETILNSIAALETRIAEVEAKVASVEGTPAADPADDQNVEEEQAHTRAYYLRKDR